MKKRIPIQSLILFCVILLLCGLGMKRDLQAKQTSKANKVVKVKVVLNKATNTLEVKAKGQVIYSCPYKKETTYAKDDIDTIRTGPSKYYKAVSSAEKEFGQKITRVGRVRNKSWAIVLINKKYYFVYNKLLSTKRPAAAMTKKLYSSYQLKRKGVIHYHGFRYTWYSQKVLRGRGLHIPGRHVDSHGYVCDKDNYICVASGRFHRGKVVKTPFGKKGKVYDSGCSSRTIDIYTNF